MFIDADWFFNGYEKGYFKNSHAHEAYEIIRRARAIKVPEINGRKMLVQYDLHSSRHPKSNGKFGTMCLIADVPALESLNIADHIDFYVPRSCASYDKKGYKNFVYSLKAILFGNRSKRMDKSACEDFFNDDDNFDI